MIIKHLKFYSSFIWLLSAAAIYFNRSEWFCFVFMTPATLVNYCEGIEKGIDMTMKHFEAMIKERSEDSK